MDAETNNEAPLINASEIKSDGAFAMTAEPSFQQYGQPSINSVEPHRFTSESIEYISTMDTNLRSAFEEIGVPPDSGKRLLQVWAKNYDGEGMDNMERETLKSWLDSNPAVNQASGAIIAAIAEKFGSEPQEIMQVFGLGLNEMRYFLSELATVGNELGYVDEQ